MFQEKDIICFLGDSITANGLYVAEVYQALRKKYHVKCYNCAISGASAQNTTLYLHSNCLIYNPDYAVILLGFNDIASSGYAEPQNDPQTRAEILQKALTTYKESYETLVKECQASGAEVILCVPVPYDQVSENSTVNYYHQDALDQCEIIIRELAQRYNCRVIDFKREMLPLLGKREIISPDRVHPTPEGAHAMAQTFLKDIGEIETCDFDTPFVMEDWNQARFDTERKLIDVNFVEFCSILWTGWGAGKTVEERKEQIRKKLENSGDKPPYFAFAYQEYLDKIDQRDKILGEIVRLTIF